MRTLEQAVPRLVMEENLLGGTPNKQTHALLADLDYLIYFCNEHATIYIISSDFSDRMTT
jgi:hypothetical protein